MLTQIVSTGREGYIQGSEHRLTEDLGGYRQASAINRIRWGSGREAEAPLHSHGHSEADIFASEFLAFTRARKG